MILVENTPIPKNIARKLIAKTISWNRDVSPDRIFVKEVINPHMPNATQANAIKNPLTLIAQFYHNLLIWGSAF